MENRWNNKDTNNDKNILKIFMYEFININRYAQQITLIKHLNTKLKSLINNKKQNITNDLLDNDDILSFYHDLFQLLLLPNFISLRKFINQLLSCIIQLVDNDFFYHNLYTKQLNYIINDENNDEIINKCRQLFAFRIISHSHKYLTSQYIKIIKFYIKNIHLNIISINKNI